MGRSLRLGDYWHRTAFIECLNSKLHVGNLFLFEENANVVIVGPAPNGFR